MNALEAEGFVRLGGPLAGVGEALLIVRAGKAEEIEDRLKADPWTRSGILSTTSAMRSLRNKDARGSATG